jgi:hypothetical protein
LNWQEEDTGDDDGLPDCDWRKKNKSKSSTPARHQSLRIISSKGRGGEGWEGEVQLLSSIWLEESTIMPFHCYASDFEFGFGYLLFCYNILYYIGNEEEQDMNEENKPRTVNYQLT